MEDLSTKVTSNSLLAVEFIQPMDEIQKLITNAGIALSAGDVEQMAKALSTLVPAGSFLLATGTMPTKILTSVGLHQPVASFVNGMKLRFRSADSNVTTCTINVDGLGAKSILREDGGALQANDVLAGKDSEVRYDTSSGGRFLLVRPGVADWPPGFSEGGRAQSDSSDALHDVRIEPIKFRDAADSINAVTTSDFVKQFDVDFDIGTADGGWAGSSRAVASPFYFHAIVRDSGQVDSGYDDSLTAVNLLAAANVISGDSSWNRYRLVHMVHTDSSTDTAFLEHTMPLNDIGKVDYGFPTFAFTIATLPTADATVLVDRVPPDVVADLVIIWSSASGTDLFGIVRPKGSLAAMPTPSNLVHNFSGGSLTDFHYRVTNISMGVDSSSQIEWVVSLDDGTLTVLVSGFRYNRSNL